MRNQLIKIQWVVIAALLILGIFKVHALKRDRDLSQTALAKEQQSATFWKDATGKARAEVTAVKTEKQIAKEVYESEIDSLRKQNIGIGRNGKGLNSVTNVTTETRDSVILKTVYDTLVVNNTITVNETLQYSDKWTQFRYDPKTNGLNYSYTDSLSIVNFDKKQGFLKPRVTTVQVVSHNPNSTITGLTQFEVEHKPKRMQFGLQAGYGITNNGLSPYAGVGLTIRIW
ncbi:hypothetical protein AWW68_19520 [Roseivirga spongicola]|uniref:DUF6808 domain-containing protein n=1 Tax=Roseivirga spongicola TaxID=333140 RepID=A0A150XCM3_9BACT|nr:hypothetical protein [Roseivirga spongicola]KYG76436.1 hypothetical protein AWW68_19520 [Roseivirga spongicola]